jgi:hypothetical protein
MPILGIVLPAGTHRYSERLIFLGLPRIVNLVNVRLASDSRPKAGTASHEILRQNPCAELAEPQRGCGSAGLPRRPHILKFRRYPERRILAADEAIVTPEDAGPAQRVTQVGIRSPASPRRTARPPRGGSRLQLVWMGWNAGRDEHGWLLARRPNDAKSEIVGLMS